MPRQRISEDIKKRIFKAFEDHEDYVEVARLLGVKRKSAWGIVNRALLRNGEVVVPRGGARYRKMDDDMTEAVCDIVATFPAYTLAQINQELRLRLPLKPLVSDSLIASTLDGRLITLKKLEDVNADRNSPTTKERRRVYAEWLLNEGIHSELVFIDEAGVNLWLKRTRGRSRRGTRAYRVVAGRRGPSFTIVFAVSPTRGLVHHVLMQRGMTSEKFINFLNEVSLASAHINNVFYICDNASSHLAAARDVPPATLNLPPTHKCHLLPPYSPMLNIVENAISAFKAAVKRKLETVRYHLQLCEHEERMATLAHLCAESCVVITAAKAHNWFLHSQRALPGCIQGVDFHV